MPRELVADLPPREFAAACRGEHASCSRRADSFQGVLPPSVKKHDY